MKSSIKLFKSYIEKYALNHSGEKRNSSNKINNIINKRKSFLKQKRKGTYFVRDKFPHEISVLFEWRTLLRIPRKPLESKCVYNIG